MAVGPNEITPETNVEELIERFPMAARVFVRRRMGCVGCDIARFETLADVARIYQQPLAELLEEIRYRIFSARGARCSGCIQADSVLS